MGEKRKKRWHAPSSTPWDEETTHSLNPAERIVRDCHRDIYRYRHAPATLEGEAEFFNGYPRDACPRCGSSCIEGHGHDDVGMRRWRCLPCKKTFTPVTGTIFHGHKLPVADWTEFLLEVFSFESMHTITRTNRRSATTAPYWMAKLFATLEGIQDDTMLSGVVQIDEKYYPLAAKDTVLNPDGTKQRGFSKNKLCIAVGCDDSGRSYFAHEGFGKPSNARAWTAYGGHIEPGSRLVHDMERTHSVLINKLNLVSEAHNSKLLLKLPDKENPLREVNRLCFLIETFLNSHSGFKRTDITGYLNLFSVIMNEPEEKMRKAAFVIDWAMRNPKTLTYREFYKSKSRQKAC